MDSCWGFDVFDAFHRRKMEISQKVAEEEERYKSEMEKYQIVHIQ